MSNQDLSSKNENYIFPSSEVASLLPKELDPEAQRRARLILAELSTSELVKNHDDAVKFIQIYPLTVRIRPEDLMASSNPEKIAEQKKRQYAVAVDAILNTSYFQDRQPENILLAGGLANIKTENFKKFDIFMQMKVKNLIVENLKAILTRRGIANLNLLENEMDRGTLSFHHTTAYRRDNERSIVNEEINKIRNQNPELYDYIFTQTSN